MFRARCLALPLLAAAIAGCEERGLSLDDPDRGASLAYRIDDTPQVPPPAAPTGPWLDFRGTSVLGFGILRVVPPPGGGAFRIDYRDTPGDGYSITDNAQLFVLPGAAFAAEGRAWAGDFLAFARTPPYGADYPVPESLLLDVTVQVAEETTLLVAYGPWTGPDTGRPPGDDPTFSLSVTAVTPGGAHAWLESEAGEMITTNWTPRPDVERGSSTVDPITRAPLWIEVRPLILYDASLARASDEPAETDLGDAPDVASLRRQAQEFRAAGRSALALDASERAADLAAVVARRDRRIVLTPELAERFRRVPIRWR